ncbi:hypothetical protein J3S85_37605 [Streptomyces lavenduligriseus]|nr:hypothetical protein J3S85_37605 [Streptomyces lavenduligriseus]
MGEWQPVYPCDARKLADAVAGPTPAPDPPEQTVHLYEKSRFPNWDRGPYIGEVPLSEAQARAEAEGAVYFEEQL